MARSVGKAVSLGVRVSGVVVVCFVPSLFGL